MAGEIYIHARSLSKKYTSGLKRSMYYGTIDFLRRLIGIRVKTDYLRKGEGWAVENMNLSVEKGDVLGIFGLNGSGKTTLIKMIAGIYLPDNGQLDVEGQIMPLFANTAAMSPLFTGRENIKVRGAALGMDAKRISAYESTILDFADMQHAADQPFGSYSSGMRARLGFSIAVHAPFDILLIDEGLGVGDARFKVKALHKLREMTSDKIIIIVSQRPKKIMGLCNRFMVMEKGSIIYESENAQEVAHFYDDYCFSGTEVQDMDEWDKEFE